MDWSPDRIRSLRNRLGLPPEAFARQLGFAHPSRVSELESAGKANRAPSKPVQIILAHLDDHGALSAPKLP